ncbi:MAG TPA: hypothetical protein VJ760_06145 [Nitrospiraceae bacterium]|nr:hypothetical protein [Nitrospiraceae bacterium]
MQLRRTHKKQKQTALHMLTVSGVVRPSHVELRYMTPLTGTTGFRTQPASTKDPQTHPVPLPSWDHDLTPNMKQTWQWAQNFSSCLVQFAKKPIVFRWTKSLDL